MATNSTQGSVKNPTADASTDNHLSVPQLARESIDHFNDDELQDWDVIEGGFDATTVTLARLTEGQA
jgi:hypothetical protein